MAKKAFYIEFEDPKGVIKNVGSGGYVGKGQNRDLYKNMKTAEAYVKRLSSSEENRKYFKNPRVKSIELD